MTKWTFVYLSFILLFTTTCIAENPNGPDTKGNYTLFLTSFQDENPIYITTNENSQFKILYGTVIFTLVSTDGRNGTFNILVESQELVPGRQDDLRVIRKVEIKEGRGQQEIKFTSELVPVIAIEVSSYLFRYDTVTMFKGKLFGEDREGDDFVGAGFFWINTTQIKEQLEQVALTVFFACATSLYLVARKRLKRKRTKWFNLF